MELQHTFTVPVGIDRAWEVLTDVETIAPCMPGAALDSVDGDNFTGTVKVKLGPIGLTYKGKASFVQKDTSAHRAVIDAQGRDARGNGTAKATVTAALTAQGDAETTVVVDTDLAITGKPAQFGRGVMVDVGNKLIGQFADCLASKLSAPADGRSPANSERAAADGEPPAERAADEVPGDRPTTATGSTATAAASASASASAAAPTPSRPSTQQPTRPTVAAEPIDLMASAGPAVAKRLVPPILGIIALIAAIVVWRRR